MLCGCNGIDFGVYDDNAGNGNTPNIEQTTVTGELYIDASNWKEWHYIDLHAIHDQILNDGSIQETFPAYPIPLTATDNWDGKSGLFYYWYDIFGQGLQNNRKSDDSFYQKYGVSDIHTDPQQEPEAWDIAIHRGDVRTNGGAAFMTSLQDIALVESKDAYASETFTEDSWNETDVWVVQDYLISQNVGNQAIAINPVLSSWLKLRIPPFPPTYTYNGNVFIVKLKDGKYAALRLKDYVNKDTGVKCCMTIEFKYPLK